MRTLWFPIWKSHIYSFYGQNLQHGVFNWIIGAQIKLDCFSRLPPFYELLQENCSCGVGKPSSLIGVIGGLSQGLASWRIQCDCWVWANESQRSESTWGCDTLSLQFICWRPLLALPWFLGLAVAGMALTPRGRRRPNLCLCRRPQLLETKPRHITVSAAPPERQWMMENHRRRLSQHHKAEAVLTETQGCGGTIMLLAEWRFEKLIPNGHTKP